MRLLRVRVTSFRSIKEPVTLNIDPKITVLIGANDHGKTNLLEAIRALNKDRGLLENDESWDLIGKDKLRIEYDFKLDAEEIENLRSLMNADEKRSAPGALEEPADGDDNPSKEGEAPPMEITFRREGSGNSLEIVGNEQIADNEKIQSLLFKARPRVELFSSATQYMDSVTLPQLEETDQEFMQGVFRYAGIWDTRKSLFTQNPGSAKTLEKASEEFTRKTRAEWTQGEDLTFKFQHAGTNGNQIELLIRDPAVSNRFVRPSERSAGFSAFFLLNMRLLARTETNLARSYVYLFDEPGTSLHPSGQINLQRVFERLSETDQVVYATHSLFMINHNRPERNRVVSKGSSGTKIDQKPYLKNWRAVRDSLGLIFAGNFFIADTTLLVEGESDAMYLGAILAAFDRAELVDVDLNLFSVQWPGNSRDFEPMARLMLEEGRIVVSLVDGDKAGTEIVRKLGKLNAQVQNRRVQARENVAILQHDKNQSIEDLLPVRGEYFAAVLDAAEELVTAGYRELADGITLDRSALSAKLQSDKKNETLGRHTEKVTSEWFKTKDKKEGISKLAIARNYCAWLETNDLRRHGLDTFPQVLQKLITGLKLEGKISKKLVFDATES